MGPEPNLLSRGTYLEALGRVPDSVEALWGLAARREGSCIIASGLVIATFGEALDRLGLCELARQEISRHAAIEAPPGWVRLRYHLYAVVDRAEGVAQALAAFVRGLFRVEAAAPALSLGSRALGEAVAKVDPAFGRELEGVRVLVSRLERLRGRHLRREGLSILRPEAARSGAADPLPHLDEAGVGPPEGLPPRTLGVTDFATEVVADAAALLDLVARAAARRIEAENEAGRALALDRRIELERVDPRPDTVEENEEEGP